jgi:glycosyltransferase involved in cell wall biosynthesis
MAALAANLDKRLFDVDVLCLTRGGPVAETLSRARVPYRVLGKSGKLAPLTFLRLLWRFLTHPPTVLHTWLFTSNTYGRLAGAAIGVRHLVASERSTDPWKRPLHRFIDTVLARTTDRIVANSRAVAQSLVSHGIPEPKITVVPNSVDTVRFRPRDASEARKALGLAVSGAYMGYIGRLAFEKRPELFVEAAKLVLKANPDAKAVLFGTGPLEADLKAAAAGFSDRIIFYGDCRDVEIAHAALDCLLLTSSWEGFPNVVLEAFASARPVVAVRMPATEELIEPGVTGLLVDGTADAIAAAALRALSDLEWSREMGLAARERVEREYSVERAVAAYERVYMEALFGR